MTASPMNFSDVLGIQLLGSAREPDEVGEEHGDDLSLLARAPDLVRYRLAAGAAKAKALGIFLTAGGTDQHG